MASRDVPQGPPAGPCPGGPPPGPEVPFRQLLERARSLAARPGRSILGITGPPAAGKTTLAAKLRDELGAAAAYVPLDGFHLAHELLIQLGRVTARARPTPSTRPATWRCCGGC